MKSLTPKQEAFCLAYLQSGNAEIASAAAGLTFSESLSGSWYTYLLIDPRDQVIFYVGKGKGKRIRDHVLQVRNRQRDNYAKRARILDIQHQGLAVREAVFSSFNSESEAFRCERTLISTLKESGLTNISPGIIDEETRGIMRAKYLLDVMRPPAPEVAEQQVDISSLMELSQDAISVLLECTRIEIERRQWADWVRSRLQEIADGVVRSVDEVVVTC